MDYSNKEDILVDLSAGDSMGNIDLSDVDSGGSDSNDGGGVADVSGVDTNGGVNFYMGFPFCYC